jgi:hypothetical protein
MLFMTLDFYHYSMNFSFYYFRQLVDICLTDLLQKMISLINVKMWDDWLWDFRNIVQKDIHIAEY